MKSHGERPLYKGVEFKDAARAAILRVRVDQVCAQIISGRLTRREATEAAAHATKELEKLVGEDRELFDRIYGSRMRRLIEQFTPPDDEQPLSP
jgi:hypothetical protein